MPERSSTETSRGRAPAAATHSLTLDRGLRALWAMRAHPDGLAVAELAELLGTHRAAVYRLLAPLTEHRLARQLSDGRFGLGAGLLDLAAGVQPRLRELALQALQALADDLGATTALTMRESDEAIVALVIAPSTQLVHLTYRTGMRHPVSEGAPGLAMLAAVPAREGEPDEVAAARRRGWARSSGQLLPGATGVAAPVLGPGGDPIAAVSAVWISGIDEQRAGARVARVAAELTESLRR